MPTLSSGLLVINVCGCHALKGPDGHPGDVGERGLPGINGEKA